MLFELLANGQSLGCVNPQDVPLAQLMIDNPNIEYTIVEKNTNDDSSRIEFIAEVEFEPLVKEQPLQMNLPLTETPLNDLLLEELTKVREQLTDLQAENLKLRNAQ